MKVFEMVDAKVSKDLVRRSRSKKCGHLNKKKSLSKEEMVQKIRAARKAGPHLVIVARTDAFGIEGLDNPY